MQCIVINFHIADEATPEVMDCPICLQNSVHPCQLPCGHIFCFLCVKVSEPVIVEMDFSDCLIVWTFLKGLKNRRCAMCRQEFSTEYLDMPNLILPNSPTDASTSNDTNEYQWFYRGRNGE